jgi:hypothetical protein
MAAKNNGLALSTAVVAAPNLQPARRNQDAGAVQNEEATAQAEHVAEIAVEFARNRVFWPPTPPRQDFSERPTSNY